MARWSRISGAETSHACRDSCGAVLDVPHIRERQSVLSATAFYFHTDYGRAVSLYVSSLDRTGTRREPWVPGRRFHHPGLETAFCGNGMEYEGGVADERYDLPFPLHLAILAFSVSLANPEKIP